MTFVLCLLPHELVLLIRRNVLSLNVGGSEDISVRFCATQERIRRLLWLFLRLDTLQVWTLLVSIGLAG